jgi:hypothetical protein
MVRRPHCDFEVGFMGLKSWRFRFYNVRMPKCPRRRGVFNYHSGLSPRSGRVSEFTIRLKPRIAGGGR